MKVSILFYLLLISVVLLIMLLDWFFFINCYFLIEICMRKSNELNYWHQRPTNSLYINSLTNGVEKNLLHAANRKIKAEIIYEGGSEPLAKRIIEPYRLFERLGNHYVESYCHRRKDFRTFRVDRIKSITVINSPQEKESTSSRKYFSPTHAPESQSSTSRGIPYWVWIIGFFLLLYFCSKLK